MRKRNELTVRKKANFGRGKRLLPGTGKQRFKQACEGVAALLLVCVFALCSVTGCKGKGPGSGTQPGNPSGMNGESTPGMNGVTVAPEKQAATDYPNGNLGTTAGRLMLYGKGLYYDADVAGGLHYVDLEKNIDLVLCNKPECRHDGSTFCVATNKKYIRKISCIYGERLLTAAVEQTDTQYLFKLLSIALDGSELEELVTFYTLEKTGDFDITMGGGGSLGELFVHRGKAVVFVEAAGQENLDDTVFSGNFVIDLETKEVSSLGEEPFGKDVMPATNLQACGDSIFYSVQEGKTGKAKNRYTLYEYNIKDKTVQKCSLQSGFQGTYAVMEDGTVYYYRTKKTEIWKYDRKTGQSELALELKGVLSWPLDDGTVWESPETFKGTGIATDGTYIYISEESYFLFVDGEKDSHTKIYVYGEGAGPDGFVPQARLHVYDKGLEKVATVNSAAAVAKLPYEEGERILLNPFYEFNGEDVYLHYGVLRDGTTYGKDLIYKIKRSEMLSGEPVAEWVCHIGIK